jgi:glycosyltransferase involved in cell wall biosynthesis
MYRLLRRIDARVYLHAGAGVEVGAYALICRLLRRRFIYVVASSADLVEEFGLVTGPLKRLFSFGLRLADAVVCRSMEQMTWLKERHGRRGVLIRTGHPVPPESSPDAAAKRSVVWVGRGHPLKQPELFLSLVEQLPDEPCVMVLMPDAQHEALATELRARAAGLPNLTLSEHLPWDRMEAVFRDAKLYVNTSTYEGFPNTFVQAAMQGTPILSWRVDPDGVLTDHGIGVCAGGSFERMAVLGRRLCLEHDWREKLGRQAQEYARKHHDLSRSVIELKVLVQQLAGGL